MCDWGIYQLDLFYRREAAVTNGLFACRPADVLMMGTSEGVKTIKV